MLDTTKPITEQAKQALDLVQPYKQQLPSVEDIQQAMIRDWHAVGEASPFIGCTFPLSELYGNSARIIQGLLDEIEELKETCLLAKNVLGMPIAYPMAQEALRELRKATEEK
jgi:hypothetical protein